jgi:hypothetical protein
MLINKTETPPPEINVPKIVEVPSQELEVEFAEPAALEVELEEAPAAAAVSTTTPRREELVPVYLLAMHLPSADLIAEDYTVSNSGSVMRVKEWKGEAAKRVAREIENMRRWTYRKIERLWCMVREFGVWITVTTSGVAEAERISKEIRERLRQLGLGDLAHRYYVRAIKVYLEPSDAKMLLDAAVSQLTSEVQELERRIKDAETSQNRRLVKELAYKKEYVKYLLMTFKKYIEDIS